MSPPEPCTWELAACVVEDEVFSPLATNVCCIPTRFDLPTNAFLAESPATVTRPFQWKEIISSYMGPTAAKKNIISDL
jgi:hypothetical protein